MVSVSGQVYTFLSCILGGLLVGLIFDIFRLSRKFIKTNDIVTYIEDILFWILVGIIVLATIFLSNNGQIRGYIFLGIFLGAIFYFLVFSRMIINTLTCLIKIFINLINRLIFIVKVPVKFIITILSKPIGLIYKKINDILILLKKILKHLITWILRFRRIKKIIYKKE